MTNPATPREPTPEALEIASRYAPGAQQEVDLAIEIDRLAEQREPTPPSLDHIKRAREIVTDLVERCGAALSYEEQAILIDDISDAIAERDRFVEQCVAATRAATIQQCAGIALDYTSGSGHLVSRQIWAAIRALAAHDAERGPAG